MPWDEYSLDDWLDESATRIGPVKMTMQISTFGEGTALLRFCVWDDTKLAVVLSDRSTVRVRVADNESAALKIAADMTDILQHRSRWTPDTSPGW